MALRIPPIGLLLLLAGACATPMAPSGGPTDTVPPEIVASTPAPDAVDVSTRSVRLVFSEYVDPGTLPTALSIAPAVEGRLAFDWGRRSVEITFPEALRENTTYVLTLDTNLRDAHGVALKTPITFAFSTGPVIDRGALRGRVVTPHGGQGVAAVDVYAYGAPGGAPPSPLPPRPDYRTQTDESGAFAFSYLREGPYYVVALQDRNRNRQPDAAEPFAVPPRPLVDADTTAEEVAGAWYLARIDTTRPAPERVRALSDRRLAIRFSEPVRLTDLDPGTWALRDSTDDAPAAVRAVYTRPDEPLDVFLVTEPLAPRAHALRPGAVADTSGNAAVPTDLYVTPGTSADTLGLRFRGFIPDTLTAGADSVFVLPPRIAPAVRFNQPVDSLRLRALVSLRDSTAGSVPYTATTRDNVTYALRPLPAPHPGDLLRVVVHGEPPGVPDTSRTFRLIPRTEVGELSGVALPADSAAAPVVQLFPASRSTGPPLRTTTAAADGRFLFTELPAGSYRIRAYLDRDGDGRWSAGRVSPYAPAEPLAWSDAEHRVRARWETALPDTMRILESEF